MCVHAFKAKKDSIVYRSPKRVASMHEANLFFGHERKSTELPGLLLISAIVVSWFALVSMNKFCLAEFKSGTGNAAH